MGRSAWCDEIVTPRGCVPLTCLGRRGVTKNVTPRGVVSLVCFLTSRGDENCHLVRARAIRLPECVVARRKCHAKKLAVGCQRCCNWLCYRHGDALAHQLVGTLHRSAGADHLDDEKCRAETLDIIFLRWDVAKRQKLSCDGVVGPSFASMK